MQAAIAVLAMPRHSCALHSLVRMMGTGKPEPLGGNLSGWWSRRINQEHRLVYRMVGSGASQTRQVAQ